METVLNDNNQAPLPLLVRMLRFIDFRYTLARYVLREHIGPFFFAFIIITFILIIDFIPNLVDLVVGKDLQTSVILRLFLYQIGWMIALSVPMSVLVATLMAFGRMTADFEITAIKSSGIHILRLIYPVILGSLVLASGLVYFNNHILPDMNQRARILMQDVRRMRPTLQIRSGAFMTDIPGYIILIDSVNYTTSELTGVKILELGKREQPPRTIVAQRGFLTFANYGRDLVFDLFDGEIHEFDKDKPEDYRRLGFKTQRIVVSDVSDEFEESDDAFRTDREKSAAQMLKDGGKWRAGIVPHRDKITNIVTTKMDRVFGDTAPLSPDSMVSDSIALTNLNREVEADMQNIAREVNGVSTQERLINSYYVEIYKKYSLPAACVVFILIGAPLGILAKRGNMGISIGISLGLFVMYWAFLIGGEDLADRQIIPAFWAMWTANILIGLAGIYLIYIVSTEKSAWTIFKLFRSTRRRQ